MWSQEKAQLLIEQLLTRSREGLFAVFRPGHYEADARDIVKQSSDIRPVELYLAFMFHEATRAGRWRPCEQTPHYLFSSREILRAYPDARIINMIRDPRDVVLSQRSKWRRRFLGGASIPVVEDIRTWCNYHPWLVSRFGLAASVMPALSKEIVLYLSGLKILLSHRTLKLGRSVNS